jgi:hypothetical protein
MESKSKVPVTGAAGGSSLGGRRNATITGHLFETTKQRRQNGSMT